MNLGVLIVEDDLDAIKLLKEILEKQNITVLIAENKDSAISIISKEPKEIDVVILDLQIPTNIKDLADQLYGFQLLDVIKKNFPSIEVVILTAFEDVNLAVKAIKKGAYDYLTKPININELKNKLENLSLIKEKQKTSEAISVSELTRNQCRTQKLSLSVLEEKNRKKHFDVFLCYNINDKSEVKEIGNQLKEQGILPWFDEWELRPGLSWQDAIENHIDKIKTAAVFIGGSGRSPWMDVEIKAILRKIVNEGSRIIPVLLKSAKTEPRLPIFLEGLHFIDFRQKDPDPLNQLIWGITGSKSK